MSLTPDERTRGADLAQKLGLRALTRAWQILFKGLSEIGQAGNGLQAAEMVLIRLAYAADLPSPDELIAKLHAASAADAARAPSAPLRGPVAAAAQAPRVAGAGAAPRPRARGRRAQAAAQPRRAITSWWRWPARSATSCSSTRSKRDLSRCRFEVGRIEVALTDSADPAIVSTLSARLKAGPGSPGW